MTYDTFPSSYAWSLVGEDQLTQNELLAAIFDEIYLDPNPPYDRCEVIQACLDYMGDQRVRDMLDAMGLSPGSLSS